MPVDERPGSARRRLRHFDAYFQVISNTCRVGVFRPWVDE
jgi:hypothetical protein